MTDWILLVGIPLLVGFSFGLTGTLPRRSLFFSHGTPWRAEPWSARPLPKEPPSRLELGQRVPLENPLWLP
jgi:hypothetical protein